MTPIEQIKAEIERLKKRAEHLEEISLTDGERSYWSGEGGSLKLLVSFINSLPEDRPKLSVPSSEKRDGNYNHQKHARYSSHIAKTDDLEKELRTYLFSREYLESKERGCLLIARHFAQWQRKQIEDEWLEDRNGCFNDGVEEGKRLMEIEMMKNAVDIRVDRDFLYDIKQYIHEKYQDYKVGDKVKIIIIKDEEK